MNTQWVVGFHAVRAVLSLNPDRAISLWVVPNEKSAQQADIWALAQQLGISIHTTDKTKLANKCAYDRHQGVALEAKPRQPGNEKKLANHLAITSNLPLVLVLDQVQDPHNFGACLRCADAAGVDAVVVAKDNASPITPVVQKVASGAAETLEIYRVSNLARGIDVLKDSGLWVLGTSDKASQSLFDEDLSVPLALVMGAEGKGLRPLTEKKCDALIRLPMAGAVVSSLNVSVASGICLFEAVRQRR